MEIKFICTRWGLDQIPVNQFVEQAINAGYDGVETNLPADKEFISLLLKAVEQHKAILVAQQWLPPAKESVEQYRKRLTENLHLLVSLSPVFINSHTGKDFFSFDDNCSLIETCRGIEEETGVKILHETHRGRFSYHAASLLPYLQRYPDLQINADFSHFCTVSESMLEDQEEILSKIIPASYYIHARVGSTQAAQVNHPFAPEWESTLNRYVSWWQNIVDFARKRGELTFYICPEFGPAPYMPALPFTRQPVSNQWDINVAMMQYLREKIS
jgi:hypothetical protein